jgi:hypothetical protein
LDASLIDLGADSLVLRKEFGIDIPDGEAARVPTVGQAQTSLLAAPGTVLDVAYLHLDFIDADSDMSPPLADGRTGGVHRAT